MSCDIPVVQWNKCIPSPCSCICGWGGNCKCLKMSVGWNFCSNWSLGQKVGNFNTQSNALLSATVFSTLPQGGTKARNLQIRDIGVIFGYKIVLVLIKTTNSI